MTNTTEELIKKRPYQLDMSYDSMWGLLDEVSTDDLIIEVEHLGKDLKAIRAEITSKEYSLQRKSAKRDTLESIIKRRKREELARGFTPTEDHKIILSSIDWECTRPLNPSPVDVCEWLNLVKPNDSYSNGQIQYAEKLIEGLPFAVSYLLTTPEQ